MLELTNHVHHEPSSNRTFGLLVAFLSGLAALYLFNHNGMYVYLVVLSILMLLLSIFRPNNYLLARINIAWSKLGLLIGLVIAPLVMMLVYMLTVIPTSIVVKLLGKDLLRLRLDKNVQTYWVDRKGPCGSMKNQF